MTDEIILIGTPRTEASDAADRLLDGIIVALQEFDTETLRAIVAERERIDPDDWMVSCIRGYLEVWR